MYAVCSQRFQQFFSERLGVNTMTTFPGAPRLLKGGLVLVDPDNGQPQQVINFQINPETVSRSLQVQRVETGGGNNPQAL